jgi:hypothetical protein
LKNKYSINGEIVIIYLEKRNGDILETYIDAKYLDKVQQLDLSWYAKWAKNTQSYYAQASKYLGKVGGKYKYKNYYLHRVICPTEKHIVIDHIDHNTLNNLESNLKPKTNQYNSTKRKGANQNGSTGIRNVSYSKKLNKYIVQLQINGKNKCFGRFDDLEEAKRCAEENRKKYYPEGCF